MIDTWPKNRRPFWTAIGGALPARTIVVEFWFASAPSPFAGTAPAFRSNSLSMMTYWSWLTSAVCRLRHWSARSMRPVHATRICHPRCASRSSPGQKGHPTFDPFGILLSRGCSQFLRRTLLHCCRRSGLALRRPTIGFRTPGAPSKGKAAVPVPLRPNVIGHPLLTERS